MCLDLFPRIVTAKILLSLTCERVIDEDADSAANLFSQKRRIFEGGLTNVDTLTLLMTIARDDFKQPQRESYKMDFIPSATNQRLCQNRWSF